MVFLKIKPIKGVLIIKYNEQFKAGGILQIIR